MAVAVVVVVRYVGNDASGQEPTIDVEPRQSSVTKYRHQGKTVKRRSNLPRQKKPVLDFSASVDGDEDTWTPDEKSLAMRIEKALDDEDLNLAIACAEKAQSCAIAEIRQSMVDTLGWFGGKALPELTPFLVDEDEDVRENAKNEWTMALADINDDEEKIGIVERAMGVLRDEDALEDISDEYIGVDEKLAVESLARIIASGGSEEGVAKAKETYEFVTGDEWTGEEEAARWIAEEYEPTGT